MKNILLIEPDSYSADLYATALNTIGFKVAIVPSAQLALDKLDDKLYDGVILELDLKGHNGFEFLYEFNSHIDWSITPVLIHSNVNPDTLLRMVVGWDELGVVDYLYKARTTLKDLQVASMNLVSTKIKQ